MILKSSLLKADGVDRAPGYAALSELPRRRRRGSWALWLATGAFAVAGGAAIVLIR